MDKMSKIDILLVGVPDALILLIFGLLLCFSDYFSGNRYRTFLPERLFKSVKSKRITNIAFNLILSVVTILSVVIYARTKVYNIMHVSYISTVLYIFVFAYIWRLKPLLALFSGLIVVSLSFSVENVFSPVLMYVSRYSDIFTQSRFLVSIPIRIAELAITCCVYTLKIDIGKLVLFRDDWRDQSFPRKITAIVLILFIFIGYTVAGAYTDILIKRAKYDIDLSMIETSINHLYYAVILLTLFGLLIISRTRNYERLKEVEQIFNGLPREQLFTNFLQSSDPEDYEKYKPIWNEIVEKGGKRDVQS